MNKIYSSFEEELDANGRILSFTKGTSMVPMLRNNKNIVVIEKKAGRLKENDVALYKSPTGKYVLHRIVKVRENDYVARGDNCLKNEYGIVESQILGVLKGYYKGETFVDCKTNKKYFRYVRYTRATRYLRMIWIVLYKLLIWVYSILRKIKSKFD